MRKPEQNQYLLDFGVRKQICGCLNEWNAAPCTLVSKRLPQNVA
jgi:hypothetical protein